MREGGRRNKTERGTVKCWQDYNNKSDGRGGMHALEHVGKDNAESMAQTTIRKGMMGVIVSDSRRNLQFARRGAHQNIRNGGYPR
jgi:hypothetical protein